MKVQPKEIIREYGKIAKKIIEKSKQNEKNDERKIKTKDKEHLL